jgi:hypothetical protein
MADELKLTASLAYEDSEGTEVGPFGLTDLLADVATKRVTRLKQNVGTSEEAINLGDVTAPGWALFVNRDATNYVELRVASGGAKFAKLLAGEFCLLRLGSGAQVPYAISNGSAVQLDYLICST